MASRVTLANDAKTRSFRQRDNCDKSKGTNDDGIAMPGPPGDLGPERRLTLKHRLLDPLLK
jgi:hypothetical protein